MGKPYDVAVIGLGAAGSAAAFHLARRGKRVIGLERFWPAHDRGSSHGRTRIIRQAYFEHEDYVPLLLRAYELWRELEAESGRELLLVTGGLMIGSPGSSVVSGALESARAHGLPHRVLDGGDLGREFPQLRVEPGEIALLEPEAGILFPEDCVRAHLDLAVRRGAELRFGVEAAFPRDPLAPGDGPVEIDAGGERIEAGRVVVTAGAWTMRLLPSLDIPLSVERVFVLWLEPTSDAAAFAPGRFPIFIWKRPGEVFYGFPAVRGDGVKVAFHHGGRTVDPDHVPREVTEDEVARMRRALARAIPALDGRLLGASTCIYTNTKDEHFAIGLLGGGRVALASACSGHGFKFSSVVGEVLADLATAGTTRLPIGFLGLDRPSLR